MDRLSPWYAAAMRAAEADAFVVLAALTDYRGRPRALAATHLIAGASSGPAIGVGLARDDASSGVEPVGLGQFWATLGEWLVPGCAIVSARFASLEDHVVRSLPAEVRRRWSTVRPADLHEAASLLDRLEPGRWEEKGLHELAVRAGFPAPVGDWNVVTTLRATTAAWCRLVAPALCLCRIFSGSLDAGEATGGPPGEAAAEPLADGRPGPSVADPELLATVLGIGTGAAVASPVGAVRGDEVLLPVDWLPRLRTEIARLARRAAKQGFPSPSLEVGTPRPIDWPPGRGSRMVSAVAVRLVLEGPIVLAAWRLAARIEDGAGVLPANLILTVPGWDEPVPDHFRTVDPRHCDHCRTVRDRSATYLVSHEDGRWAQVGRSCLRDFTGHDPEASLAWMGALSRVVPDPRDLATRTAWINRSGEPGFVYDFDTTLEYAARITAVEGFTSRRAAEEDGRRAPTSDIVWGWLHADDPAERREYERRYPVVAEAEDLQTATRDAISALGDRDAATLSTFEANVHVLWLGGSYPARRLGLAVAAVVLGQRRLERRAAEQERAGLPPSRFVGQAGERLRGLVVQVFGVHRLEDAYRLGQMRMRVTARLPGGELFGWWAADDPDFVMGTTARIDGTVKSHVYDRRDGAPMNELNRVRVLDVAVPATGVRP